MNKKRARSLRTIILATSITVMFGFSILLFGIIYKAASSQLENNILDNTEGTLVALSNQLDHNISSVYAQLAAFTDSNTFNLFLWNIYNNNEVQDKSVYIRLSNEITTLYQQNTHVFHSVFLNLDNNSIMLYKGDNSIQSLEESLDPLFETYPYGYLFWQNPKDEGPFTTVYPQNNSFRLSFLLGTKDTTRKGIFTATIKPSFITDILDDNAALTKNSQLALLNGETLINSTLTTETMPTSEEISNLKKGLASSTFSQFTKNGYLYLCKGLKTGDLSLLAIVPVKELMLPSAMLATYLKLILIFLFIFYIILTYLLSKKFEQPINVIINKMSLVGQGHFDTYFNVTGTKEIERINDNAQKLTEDIRDLLKQITKEKDNLRRSEFLVLQAQINPHFLYNTLYSIRQLNEIGEYGNAIKMIDFLAAFYRIGVSNGKKIIPLRDEVEHVRSYMAILKLRFEHQFSTDISLDQEFLDIAILKLTLQPLVENAINHGIRPTRRCGIISITAKHQEESLYLFVSDNGQGMDENTLQEVTKEMTSSEISENKNKAYGLRNVHQRLQIAFGVPYGLSIQSKLDEGTTITIRVPFNKVVTNDTINVC
ncbi:sensor histidine kinase [uncultured Sphaerochaeta sp.]|uniref:sensor histidine kinase n=1 Tax=uncultured Sphaerochaeta sp. TaxID=886478 RepID=UPI002A0AA0B3|nr:sensor histidine kinase [uncultured Sphaerochaeta sp.]